MSRWPVLVATFVLGLSVEAAAGVTIHYSGSASDAARARAVLASARKYAAAHHWRVTEAPEEVVLYPAEWCEPIHLKFEGAALAKDFVKTQFAGASVHRDVVGLFRGLAPLLRELKIDDESGYWDDRDYAKLQARLAMEAEMIARAKQRKGGSGPVKLDDGRILDIIR